MSLLRVGIAGLGTVGGSLVKLLRQQAESVEARCGVSVEVTSVSARDKYRKRDFDIDGLTWHENATGLASDKNVDVICELIGGSDGISLDLCQAAIKNGKHIVTANKALMAMHGADLAEQAEKNSIDYSSFNEVNDIYENIKSSDVVSSAIKERVNKIHEFYSNK